MRNLIALSLVVGFLTAGNLQSAEAKKYTIFQRQSALNLRISRAERARELTFKEARKLRDDLADIQEDKTNMINDNGGRLSYKDEDKLEKKLNRVSDRIHELKLAKRVAFR